MDVIDEYLLHRYVGTERYETQQKETWTMHEIELKRSNVNRGDVVAAWVLYAALLSSLLLFSMMV